MGLVAAAYAESRNGPTHRGINLPLKIRLRGEFAAVPFRHRLEFGKPPLARVILPGLGEFAGLGAEVRETDKKGRHVKGERGHPCPYLLREGEPYSEASPSSRTVLPRSAAA